MPVPKRKTSKSKKRMRRSHWNAPIPPMATCSHCGQPVMPHRVCPGCGYYKNRQVIEPVEA
ncbi:MAG: 50S ribosomal protein L32 [Candidatus Latescibacteria bacterium]|nr:50S ribosomal protein L32 [Candidatus Latescibacterota bacterium]